MKGRFAIVSGLEREAIAARLSSKGLEHFAMPGCDVFADAGLIVSADRRGPCVVLGTLFHRLNHNFVEDLGIGHVHAVVGSGGRHLIEHFWGAYIAIGGASGECGSFLIRDPSAHIAAYRWALPGCDLYFNDFALACSVSGQSPACDWTAVAHRLRFPLLRIADTGLINITEIVPGSRICLETGSIVQLWSPWHYTSGGIDPPLPAALKAMLVRCTRAWASRFKRIDLELSGGLDSSIVAACLTGTEDVQCLSYATEALEGDERRYARAVAEQFAMPLDEWIVSTDALETTAMPMARVRPGGFGVFAAIDRELEERARARGADALFSGGGGDNIFCKIRSAGPVVDAIMQKHFRLAFRTAKDLAELCETNVWDAAVHTVRQWRGRGTWSWSPSDLLLSRNARVACRGHPWLDEGARDIPGKRSHIANLTGVLPFLDGYDRAHAFPMIFPLLSQPVMELCLSIPTWHWIEGGRDRAVARDAFERVLPAAVVRRRSKGGLRSVMIPAFERDRTALAQLLCKGRLAEQGMIDRDAVAALIARPLSPLQAEYVRIFELADVELWVRSIERLGRAH